MLLSHLYENTSGQPQNKLFKKAIPWLPVSLNSVESRDLEVPIQKSDREQLHSDLVSYKGSGFEFHEQQTYKEQKTWTVFVSTKIPN